MFFRPHVTETGADLIAMQSRDERTAEVNVLKTEIANLAAKVELLQVKISNIPQMAGVANRTGKSLIRLM